MPNRGSPTCPFIMEIFRQVFFLFQIFQTVYFTISLLNDLFGSNDAAPRKLPLIRKLKDLVFSVAFPAAVYVSSSFWSIYNYDKELIFPEELAKVFPLWLNHTMHTTVSIFLLIDLLLTNRSYPSRKVGMFFTLVFNFAYITWMHIIYDRMGAWPYPIFHVLSFPMRIAFLGLAVVLAIVFYFIGEKLSGVLSSAPKKQKAEPKKKRK